MKTETTFEIEITRHNVTAAQFLAYVRARVDAKGGRMCRSDLDLDYFKRGDDLNYDTKHKGDPDLEGIHEKSVSKPYEMQTYIRYPSGATYNEICEWNDGTGYYYLVNIVAIPEAEDINTTDGGNDNAPSEDTESEKGETTMPTTENTTPATWTPSDTTRENKAEVLSVSRYALRGLHDLFGFDFCKPHDVLYIFGKYTVNQINKAVASAGYDRDALVVVLTRNTNPRHRYNDDFKAVQIFNGGFSVEFDRKIPSNYRGCRTHPFDDFYAKKCFDELRKEPEAVAYIFAQSREYVNLPAMSAAAFWGCKPDLSERFNVGKVTTHLTSAGARYVGKVELLRRDGRGERYTYETNGGYIWGKRYEPEIGDLFDKSGYYVRERRDELKRKAAALRAEREKAAFIATDNAAKVEELRGMIEARKMEIVSQLANAHTSADLKAVESAVAYFRGLGGIMCDFERYERNSAEKRYNSIADADRAYNAIKSALESKKEAA